MQTEQLKQCQVGKASSVEGAGLVQSSSGACLSSVLHNARKRISHALTKHMTAAAKHQVMYS